MNSFLIGLLLILAGGFLQGSFAVLFKFVKPLKWEIYWSMYAIAGLILAPIVFAAIVISHFFNALFSLSTQDLLLPAIFGGLWGISGIAFGRSLEKVGIGITYIIVLGISMFISTIMSFPNEKQISLGFFILILGLLLLLAGIILGLMTGIRKSNFKAILPALLSGIFSSMLAYGFSASQNIAVNASSIGGASKDNAVSLVWLVLLLSSGVVTLLYTSYVIGMDNFKIVARKITMKSLLACLLAGLFWFGGFILYSFGPAKLGNFGNAYGWAMFIVLSLVTANIWSSWQRELKDRKAQWIAVSLIIVGIIVVGWGLGK